MTRCTEICEVCDEREGRADRLSAARRGVVTALRDLVGAGYGVRGMWATAIAALKELEEASK